MSELRKNDVEIFNAIFNERNRQQDEIQLIASENIVSKAVLETQGSILTNKYAEGYPSKRYYGGCEYVDVVENIAIERAKKLFNVNFANVQPNSGSQANQAVFFALMQPNDTFLGLDLSSGGHLTHGANPNMSGKWFNPISYNLNKETMTIDYDMVEDLAKKHNPKIIIAGGSAYSRDIDFKKFREIADMVGAYLMVDMAHIAGLVAAGVHQSPFPHAHVATTTTHKTLRGPRGGMILTNDEILSKKFNSAIFPGIQGGPLMHVIAGKAVAFGEALTDDFKKYSKNVVNNAKVLAKTLTDNEYDIVSGGTDNHMFLVDLRSKGLTGKLAEETLGRVNITCNKNSIPFDNEKPTITSGIRLGTPSGTSRGFGENEFKNIGELIVETLELLRHNHLNDNIERDIRNHVLELTKKFPIY